MTLKLFVWENVLTDYTSGMVCVLAETEDQAWELMDAKDPVACSTVKGYGEVPREEWPKPQVVEKPEAFIVWGGS